MSRVACSDYLLVVVVLYAYASVFSGSWDYRYDLLSQCRNPIHLWLLINASLLPIFKISELLLTSPTPHTNESLLFKRGNLMYTIFLLLILYPLSVELTILGTFWYAEAIYEPSCLSEEIAWYISMWLIVFYCWIIGYTTYISYVAIFYLKNRQQARQYDLLLNQYGGIEAPMLNHEPQGLTPLEISRITIEELPDDDNDSICTICLDRFKRGEKIRITICEHKFHLPCIDDWLMRKGSCPNCKQRLR